tara:strand:- start:38 stop:655 length:618 start_codon:yes stop_codon:yes gene_type:complete
MKRDLSFPLAATPNPGDKPKKKKRVTRTKRVTTSDYRNRPARFVEGGDYAAQKKANPGKGTRGFVKKVETKTKTTPKKTVVKKTTKGPNFPEGGVKTKTVTRKRKDGSTVTRSKTKYAGTKSKSRTVKDKKGTITKQKAKTTKAKKIGFGHTSYSRAGFEKDINPTFMKKGKKKITRGSAKGTAKATITKRKGKEKVKSTYRRNK